MTSFAEILNIRYYISMIEFEPRTSIEQVEESQSFAPKFDEHGLIPVITTDYDSGEVLMQGYMNREALRSTISPLVKPFIFLEADKHYGTKEKPVGWYKPLKKFELMMIKTAFGYVLMFTVPAAMLGTDPVFTVHSVWKRKCHERGVNFYRI